MGDGLYQDRPQVSPGENMGNGRLRGHSVDLYRPLDFTHLVWSSHADRQLTKFIGILNRCQLCCISDILLVVNPGKCCQFLTAFFIRPVLWKFGQGDAIWKSDHHRGDPPATIFTIGG